MTVKDRNRTLQCGDAIYLVSLKSSPNAAGKSDGYDGFSSDYYCNGTPLLSRYVSALFNCMITHCYVPNPFCISTIIPIPKGSNKSTCTVKKTIEVLLLAVYFRKYLTTA